MERGQQNGPSAENQRLSPRSGTRRNTSTSSRSSLKQSSSTRGSCKVRQGSHTPPPPAPAKPSNRVPLRGGGGVSKSKSAPVLQEEAIDHVDSNCGERTIDVEQQGNLGSPEGSRRPVRSLRGDRALPRPRSPNKGPAASAAVPEATCTFSYGTQNTQDGGSGACAEGKDATTASATPEPQSLERTVLDFGFPSAADPREWLVENSERLLAQTEKCLVVHRKLQRLLLAGEALDGRDNCEIKRELGADGGAGYLSRTPTAAYVHQQATAAVEVLTAETACPGTPPLGEARTHADSNLKRFLENPRMVDAARQSAVGAMKARRDTRVLGYQVELAALKRRRSELRSELSHTTEVAAELQRQIGSAKSASDQFHEAVTSCCEAELTRLNNQAGHLEARIAEQLEFLKFTEQARHGLAKGNSPAGGRPTSASSSGTPRRTASGGALIARGPAPLVAGVRGPLSPPRRPGTSPQRSAIQATVGREVTPTTRRPSGVATPPVGAPTNRRVVGRSSASSNQLGGALASSAERHRFTASPGTVVNQHTVQLRTPPRSKQVPASTERSAERLRPGSLTLERSTEKGGSEGSRGRLGGSSALPVTRTRQGSNHGTPRPSSPKPSHGHAPGLIRSSAAPTVTALPPQMPGLGDVQRHASTPRSHAVLQHSGATPTAAAVAATNAGMHQAPGVTMSSTARNAVASRSAVAASAAARTASPGSVLQSLQHLETVRCQVQADFWSQ